MEIEVKRKEFLSVLGTASVFAGKSKTLSVLDNVKIQVSDSNKMYIESYDTENAIIKSFEMDSNDGTGSFLINPKDLINSFKVIKDDCIKMQIDDNSCVIIHSKGSMTLPIFSDDDYPKPNIDKAGIVGDINTALLYNWLCDSRSFLSNDDMRPALCGAYIYIKGGVLGIAASDGVKLFHDSIECDSFDGDADAIINGKTINAILDVINGTESVHITIGERNISFNVSGTSMIVRKTEGRYPNFDPLLKQNGGIHISCDKVEFIDSITRTMVTANSVSSLLKLSISGISINIKSEDLDFSKKSLDICSCVCEGGEITIGLRGTHLRSCLDVIESETVYMEMSEPDKAVIFKDKNNSNRFILLMPSLLN